jgi:molecular chaperone GrpE
MTDDTNIHPDGGAQPPPEAPASGAEQPDTEALRQQLEAAQAKSAEYLEGWQRARAEFANYKRRVEKEQSESYQNAAGRVVGRFLDVLDDFERAMTERPHAADPALEAWAAGMGLIQRKLQAVLEAEGVARIEAEGQAFDPQVHEAVTHEDNETVEPGHIIGVVRPGYRLGDRVIRPALVRVAR